MKKIKLNSGLKLNKESITKLQESQLSNFRGGKGDAEDWSSCICCSCNTKAAKKPADRLA